MILDHVFTIFYMFLHFFPHFGILGLDGQENHVAVQRVTNDLLGQLLGAAVPRRKRIDGLCRSWLVQNFHPFGIFHDLWKGSEFQQKGNLAFAGAWMCWDPGWFRGFGCHRRNGCAVHSVSTATGLRLCRYFTVKSCRNMMLSWYLSPLSYTLIFSTFGSSWPMARHHHLSF